MPADSFSKMDSNGSNNEPNWSELLGSSPGASSLRQRTESESSDKNALFILPNADGSPAKVLSLSEVANVMKNIQNMSLAHEIVLNPDFKLRPYEPPENSLERRVKEIVHKAFWDSLREQLNSTPPSYDCAIQLLADIKELFPQILAQNNKVLDYINEVLDASIIKQQVEQGVLDFKAYAHFVINIMAKSCAPARDEIVEGLTKIDDVVDTFRGILETMALMKLDMANYLLDSSRNTIMANSVEYEKAKFKEYLEYYKLGFPATEDWLKRNSPQTDINNTTANPQNTASQIILSAFLELMDWNHDYEFPEILSIDKERIFKLGYRAKRLCVCASLISICSGVPIISQRPDNRAALAKQFEILLQESTDEKSIADAFENIWLQTKKFINDVLEKEEQSPMDSNSEDMLRKQLTQVPNPNGPVRLLMWRRLQTYFTTYLKTKVGLSTPPSGFTDYKDELESYAVSMKKVIFYNNAVFGDYFVELLTKGNETSQPKTTTVNAAASNPQTIIASTSSAAKGFTPLPETSKKENDTDKE